MSERTSRRNRERERERERERKVERASVWPDARLLFAPAREHKDSRGGFIERERRGTCSSRPRATPTGRFCAHNRRFHDFTPDFNDHPRPGIRISEALGPPVHQCCQVTLTLKLRGLFTRLYLAVILTDWALNFNFIVDFYFNRFFAFIRCCFAVLFQRFFGSCRCFIALLALACSRGPHQWALFMNTQAHSNL